MRRDLVLWVGAAALGLVSAVVVVPDLVLGLDRHSPFAQLVPFRPHLLVLGSLVLVAVLLRWPAGWRVLAGCIVVVAVGVAAVLPRIVPDAPPGPGPVLTVLSLNTLDGRADVDALAGLVRAERPDVVVLIEAGEDFRSRFAPTVASMGFRWHGTSIDPADADIRNVVAAASPALGEVRARVVDGMTFPLVELSGGGLGPTRVLAFHAAAPLPQLVPEWRDDLGRLREWCAGPGPAVVAGDFNATLDHSALRRGMDGCVDAADQSGAGLVPTWGPAGGWRWIGPQIDHVLTKGSGGTESFRVVDVAGTDHRAVVARIRMG